MVSFYVLNQGPAFIAGFCISGLPKIDHFLKEKSVKSFVY